MAKTPIVDKKKNGKAEVLIDNRKEIVDAFCAKNEYLNLLTKDVSGLKVNFRDWGKEDLRASGVPEANRVKYISAKHEVNVTLGDPELEGNRTAITSKVVQKILQMGFDIREMGVTETKVSYTLEGEYATWFAGWVQENFVSKGLALPDQIKRSETTKLSAEGVKQLQATAHSAKSPAEKEVAEYLLEVGLKDPTVSSK